MPLRSRVSLSLPLPLPDARTSTLSAIYTAIERGIISKRADKDNGIDAHSCRRRRHRRRCVMHSRETQRLAHSTGAPRVAHDRYTAIFIRGIHT